MNLWEKLGPTFPEEQTKRAIEDVDHVADLQSQFPSHLVPLPTLPSHLVRDVESKLLPNHDMPAAAKPLVQLSLHPECDVSVFPVEFLQGRDDNFYDFLLPE